MDEDDSRLADELWTRAPARSASQLVYPEARAALAAAQRIGRIDERAHRIAIDDLDAACSAMSLIGVDWTLAQHAGELAERHALRGYDSVHLATALAAHEPELVLVTWDRDLSRAASEAGIAAIPADQPPSLLS